MLSLFAHSFPCHFVQRGYCLHERVLRPARVVVASAPTGQAGDEAG